MRLVSSLAVDTRFERMKSKVNSDQLEAFKANEDLVSVNERRAYLYEPKILTQSTEWRHTWNFNLVTQQNKIQTIELI